MVNLMKLYTLIISCKVSANFCVSLFVFSLCVCFAAVSPSASSYNETLSTLRYAAHARNIVNKPQVNEVSGCLESDVEI